MDGQFLYEDFDLLIVPGPNGLYRARVLRSPAGESAPVEFALPFSDIELENFVLKVGRPGRATRGSGRPEIAPLKDFGGKLFGAVFRGDIRDALHRSLSQTRAHGAGMRLRLRLNDTPELAGLPWEFLYDRRANRFLAQSRRTPLVRYLDLPDPPHPVGVDGPLRVLVMISNPGGYPELDVEREWAALTGALARVQEEGRVVVDRLPANMLTLRQRLRRGEFHVLHFVGHGFYKPEWDDGVLVMETRDGRPHEVTGEELGGLLNEHDATRLAVLNACEGARSGTANPFAGMAQSLIQQGLPAVVAMQFEITDEAAIIFAHELYGAIADGYPLEAALAEARGAIRDEGNLTEWGTPVLYSRAPDGQLFDVTGRDGITGSGREAAAPGARAGEAPDHWTLPPKVGDEISSPSPRAKLAALEDLRRLYQDGDATVRKGALEAIRVLAEDDSRSVSTAASQLISGMTREARQPGINGTESSEQAGDSSQQPGRLPDGEAEKCQSAETRQGAEPGSQETHSREHDVLIPIAGILDVLDNYGFVRTTGYLPGSNDVYVSLSQTRRYGLRKGDVVEGAIRQPREGERREKFNALVRLDKINGLDPEAAKTRPEFAKLVPLYPQERLRLETDPTIMTTRIIDLVCPIGKGQRGLIVSPAKAGKTMILQAIANAVTKNNPECHLMVVLVDERPEEITDMQRTVRGEVIHSDSSRPAVDHVMLVDLALERAKRLVEMGHDIVVLLDSITRLGRACSLVAAGDGQVAPSTAEIAPGAAQAAMLTALKRFAGAARNIEKGGSLTIVATLLTETGSATDGVIFEEFKDTASMELRLSRDLANKRIFPAVDVSHSGTSKAELLMSRQELKIVPQLRSSLSDLEPERALRGLIDRMKDTKNNAEFLIQAEGAGMRSAMGLTRFLSQGQ